MSVPSGELAQRFQTLARHPELAALKARVVEEHAQSAWTPGSVLTLAGLALAGLFASVVLFSFCPPLGLLPLALVGFGGYALVQHLITRSRRSREPVVSVEAFVVEQRKKLESAAAANAHTRHHALLEFADGSRRELEVDGSVADELRSGDLGIALLSGETLVGFTTVDV